MGVSQELYSKAWNSHAPSVRSRRRAWEDEGSSPWRLPMSVEESTSQRLVEVIVPLEVSWRALLPEVRSDKFAVRSEV